MIQKRHLYQILWSVILLSLSITISFPLKNAVEKQLTTIRNHVLNEIRENLAMDFSYERMSPSILTFVRLQNLEIHDQNDRFSILSSRVSLFMDSINFTNGRPEFERIHFSGGEVDLDLEKMSGGVKVTKEFILDLLGLFKEIEFKNFTITLRNGESTYLFQIDRLIIQERNDQFAVRVSGQGSIESSSEESVLQEGEFQIKANGSLSKDLDSFSLDTQFDQIVSQYFDLEPQQFQINFSNDTLHVRKIKDKQPLDLDVQFHLPSQEIQFSWESDQFKLSDQLELKDNLRLFNPWLNSEISGNALIVYDVVNGDIQYSFNTNVRTANEIITQYIPDETQVSAIFSGNNQRVDIEHFRADTSIADLEYRGSFDLERRAPFGVLELENLELFDGVNLNTTIDISFNEDYLNINTASINLDDHDFGTLQMIVEPKWDEKSIYFSSLLNNEQSQIFIDGDLLFHGQFEIQTWFDIDQWELEPLMNLFLEDNLKASILETVESPVITSGGYFHWSGTDPFVEVANFELKSLTKPSTNMHCSFVYDDDRFDIHNLILEKEDLVIEGMAQGFIEENVLQTKLLWYFGGVSYDWDIKYTFQDSLDIVGNHGLKLSIDLLSPGNGVLEVETDELPIIYGPYEYNLTMQSRGMLTNTSRFLELNQWNLKIKQDEWQIGEARFQGVLQDNFLQLYSLKWIDDIGEMNGHGNIQFLDFIEPSLWAWFELNSDNDETLGLNFGLDTVDSISSMVEWSKLNISRFFQREIQGSSSGELEFSSNYGVNEANGFVSLEIIDGENRFEAETELNLTESNLILTDTNLSTPWANMENLTALCDLENNSISLTSIVNGRIGDSEWTSGLTSHLAFNALTNTSELEMVGTVMTDPVLIDQETVSPSHVLNVQYNPHQISLSHSDPQLLNIEYTPINHRIKGNTSRIFPISFFFDGSLGDNVLINISNIHADLQWLNRLLPRDDFDRLLVEIEDGSLDGALRIQGDRNNPLFYGYLNGQSVEVDTLFSYEEIAPTNLDILFQGHRIEINPFQLHLSDGGYIDSKGEIVLEYGEVSNINISSQLISNRGEDGGVQCIYPVAGLNLEGLAEGEFQYTRNPIEDRISGDFLFNQLNISLGQNEGKQRSADNRTRDRRVIVDLNFVTGKDVRFVLPNEELTFLEAQAATEQELQLLLNVQEGDLSFQGELLIDRGEIFYFNRSFILNEGSIVFDESGEDFNPTLALEAELLSQDNQGDDVRIVLSYRGSLFENFEPTIQSVPMRSQSEILALLGQPIGAGTEGDRELLSSIVMATSSVVGQYSLILPFENALKSRLNLDRVTVDTEILENILMDKLSLQGVYSEGNNQYNLWAYLDGTRLDMGRYLAEELYFNGAVILDVNPLRSDYAFGGVNLQFDFSFEMATPFFNIGWSFTPDQWDSTNSDELFISDTAVSLEFHL